MASHSDWVVLLVLLSALIPAGQILWAEVRGEPCSPALRAVGVLGALLNWTLLYALGKAFPDGEWWVRPAAGMLLAAGIWALVEVLRRQERGERGERLACRRECLEEVVRDREARDRELQAQLEELRRLRHDLRHYLVAVDGLRAGARGQATVCTETLRAQLAQPVPAASVLEAVVRHYVAEAEAAGIAADVRLDVGEPGGITAPDLCLVVGNLLENAVEAVSREPAGGCIRMRCDSGPGWLSIVAGNTFTGQLRAEKGGFLSSKAENRRGKGLERVRRVAVKYGGGAWFTADGAMFRAEVFLVKPDPPSVPAEPGTEPPPGVL